MEHFLKKVNEKFGKTFSAETLFDGIITIVSEKDAEIDALKPLAEEGKAYRKSLVDATLKYGTMIDEIETGEESQKAEEAFLNTVPIDRLKSMNDKYEKRAREEYPQEFTFEGTDTEEREAGKTTQPAGEGAGSLVKDAKERAEASQK